MRAILLGLLLATSLLAGCSGSDGGDATTTKPPISKDKGAIDGLLIDDIYRPIAGAKVLLLPIGLTTTTDNSGQFRFIELAPGAYTLKVESDGHEGNPMTVDVVANEYREVEFSARRVSSVGSLVETTQYSVFLPCAVASPVILGTVNCLGDISGDSYRSGISGIQPGNGTLAVVVEYTANKEGNYVLACRHDNGLPDGGEQYANIVVSEATYGKGVLLLGEANEGLTPWNNDKPMECVLFYGGQVQTDETGYGIGADVGISATIILSTFYVELPEDFADYHTLAEVN